MSNVAKLKKQAAELEQKKQFDKALAVYVKLLENFDENAAELDVALFNRVGDMMIRQGNVADAVDYYEKAVDHYSETGFFNNAIALCNKILRHSPGRASVYYKLGKISAQKGFKADAKVNFLEYADRMQKAGKVDEAFRALKEFADLCPDQHEIRLMLADQLTKQERKPEAIEQLQILYERYDSEGRAAEASATADRMRAIDPTVEPRSGSGMSKSSNSDLIFLDLDAPTYRPSQSVSAPVVPPPASRPAPPPPPPPAPIVEREVPQVAASDDLVVESTAIESPESAMPIIDTPMSGIHRIGDDAFGLEKTPSESLLGLELTRIADDEPIRGTPSASLLDIEPTSLTPSEPPPVHRSSSATHAELDGTAAAGGDLDFVVPDVPELTPVRSKTPSIESFNAAALATPLASPVIPPPKARPSTPPGALDDLPLMEMDLPVAPPPTPRASVPIDQMTLSADLDLIDVENETTDDVGVDLDSESLTLDDEEVAGMPTPSIARRSTMVALHAVEVLQASVEGEPDNWSLRRELAEAMLEAGDREGGIRELESTMSGAERSGDLDLASSLAEEIARLEPEAVKHHQKRVEFAFRTNDRPRLIEAYLSLGDALLQSDQADKARTVYQRVLDLAPDELRAQSAIETIAAPEPEPPPPPPTSRRRSSGVHVAVEPPKKTQAPASNDSFVNLGDWLRDEESPKDTRMIVAEQEPSGDEEADFADMLRKFKQGVAENVDAEDYQSHYDLAIAFKEMGLLDEAIAEFQKALGSPTNRLPTYEALGQCFLDKGQTKLASSILSRALNERASEDQLVGVLYLLGRAAEEQGHAADALAFYQRVFVLDIQFRDIAERMNEVERAAR